VKAGIALGLSLAQDSLPARATPAEAAAAVAASMARTSAGVARSRQAVLGQGTLAPGDVLVAVGQQRLVGADLEDSQRVLETAPYRRWCRRRLQLLLLRPHPP